MSTLDWLVPEALEVAWKVIVGIAVVALMPPVAAGMALVVVPAVGTLLQPVSLVIYVLWTLLTFAATNLLFRQRAIRGTPLVFLVPALASMALGWVVALSTLPAFVRLGAATAADVIAVALVCLLVCIFAARSIAWLSERVWRSLFPIDLIVESSIDLVGLLDERMPTDAWRGRGWRMEIVDYLTTIARSLERDLPRELGTRNHREGVWVGHECARMAAAAREKIRAAVLPTAESHAVIQAFSVRLFDIASRRVWGECEKAEPEPQSLRLLQLFLRRGRQLLTAVAPVTLVLTLKHYQYLPSAPFYDHLVPASLLWLAARLAMMVDPEGRTLASARAVADSPFMAPDRKP